MIFDFSDAPTLPFYSFFQDNVKIPEPEGLFVEIPLVPIRIIQYTG